MSLSPTGPPTLAGASAGQRGETAEWPRLAGRTAEAHEPPVQSTPPFLTRGEHPWPTAPVPFGFSLQILVIALWPLAPRDSQLAVFRLTHRLRRLTQSVPRILSRVPWSLFPPEGGSHCSGKALTAFQKILSSIPSILLASQ